MNTKKIFSTILVIAAIALPAVKVQAVTVLAPESVALDKSILKSQFKAKLPVGIYVMPIFLPTDLKVSATKWYRGLYYYTVERLGFGDVPFHYVVTSKGDVFSTGGSDEKRIPVENLGDDNILIAYLSDQQNSSFTPAANSALQNLLLDVCNRNSIRPENVKVSGVKFQRNEATREVIMSNDTLFGFWENSVKSISETIRPSYSPQEKQFNLQITNLNIPSDVEAGAEVDASVKLKNIGNVSLYGGTDNTLIANKTDSGGSKFYVNNIWLSQSQFQIMSDDQILAPGEELEFRFKLKTSLYLGNVSENFEFRTLGGQKVNVDNMTIAVNVNRGSKRIIQINSTETDFLRVRSEPSTVSEEIGRVGSGERFFVVSEDPSGFLKIDLGNGTQGWVAGWLTTTI